MCRQMQEIDRIWTTPAYTDIAGNVQDTWLLKARPLNSLLHRINTWVNTGDNIQGGMQARHPGSNQLDVRIWDFNFRVDKKN